MVDNAQAQEILDKAVASGARKKLVSFFTSFTMDLYKSNRKRAEQLFEWITLDDSKAWKKDPDGCIDTLIQDPKFLQDVSTLISLEHELTKKENLGRTKFKSDGSEVKPRAKVECNVKAEDMGNVDKLLARLKEIDRSSSEARKIRQTLRKLGHRGGAK